MATAQKQYYALHRWLGALFGVQLLLWTVGGIIFATHDIEHVRGRVGMNKASQQPLDLTQAKLTPGQAVAAAGGDGTLESVTLRMHLATAVYDVDRAGLHTLVNATTGAVVSPIDEATARAVALNDRATPPAVAAVTLVSENPPSEYRGGKLPAWRVDLDDGDGTHLWIDARTGKVKARRNDAWRRFDFFWMLHTMDYADRDDFNTWVLILFACAALLTLLSGFLLWGVRIKRRLARGKAWT